MPKRQPKHECPECECPDWIFTFADMVMLMMGFFVVLWVLKPPPGSTDVQAQAKWIDTASEIKEGFFRTFIPSPDSQDPLDQRILNRMQNKPFRGEGKGGKTNLERQGAEGTDPDVTKIREGTQSTTGGRLLFAQGDAKLTPQTIKDLDQIVMLIRGHRNIVIIKGHASSDDLPDSAAPAEKMDLSLRRAQVVVDFLRSKAVEEEILRVQGCSTFEPIITQAYTPQTQALNRRVEVQATATLVEDLQDPRKSAATLPIPPEPQKH